MSRHYYKTQYQEKPIIVMMGYDRPFNGFFMVIEQAHQEDDEYIFSNLFDNNPYPNSLNSYKEVLSELGIFIPDEMFLEVEADAEAKMGNKDVYHSIEDGTHRRVVA